MLLLYIQYSILFTLTMNNQIQNKIISAASRRLAHYGYSKTTMAEIANPHYS
ncbi:MAG TPA: TetR family transcriptional regulator [Mariprofundaceae bacterium]|nr:TetR family transcriptional regulator [Mariprofundaceae bacterium]